MINIKYIHLTVRYQSELLHINRSILYYEKSDKMENFTLSNMIAGIYAQYPIYGYRKIIAMLQRKNIAINHKEYKD